MFFFGINGFQTVLVDFSLLAIGVSKLYTFIYTGILSADWKPGSHDSDSSGGSGGGLRL